MKKKRAITYLNAPNGSRDIPFQSQEFEQDGLLRYCAFIFSLSCNIASVTSYLSENEAENLQNGDIHLVQIPDYEMEYLENHLAH